MMALLYHVGAAEIGQVPSNLTFTSSRDIKPMLSVQPILYNEAGFIAHPLQRFGRPGGVQPRTQIAGTTGNAVGGIAWDMGHPHLINGKQPGS